MPPANDLISHKVKSDSGYMLKETPGISIITPFFNTGKVFWETHASIIKQTFRNWHWIIVNDGSNSEESLEILKQLSISGDNRITVINLEKNIGLPGARNHGISQAKHEYLAFIDSDDIFDATALEKFYLCLKNNNNIQFVNSYVNGFEGQVYEWKGGFHDGEAFLKENRNTSCFVGRKYVFDEVLFDENLRDGGEDWDFWLHAASKGFWGYTIPELLIWYRRKTGTPNWKVLSSQAELEKHRKALLDKYGTALTRHNFPKRSLQPYTFEKPILENNVQPLFKRSASRKILFIFPWLEVGGADKFNLDLVEGLANRNWEITIVCTKSGDQPWQDLFKKHTVNLFFFPNYSDETRFYSLFEDIINSRTPDIVFVSNSTYGYYLIPFIRQRFPQLPIVDYLHCEDLSWYNGGYPIFSSIFTALLDKTLVSSRHLKEWCIDKGIVPDKLSIIYTNIDTNAVARNLESRKKIRALLNIPDNIPVILYVARLTEQKQPLLMLAAIEKLFSKTSSFKVLVIGDGPDKSQFIKTLKKNKSKANILYLGALPNSVVKDYMDASDIFFLPTAFEGIALSIFEAMAKELPVVAANVGGQAELVTDGCGFLVERISPEHEALTYADHLYYLVTNTAFRNEAGKLCRQRVEQYFQLNAMLTNIESTINQAIKGHNDTFHVMPSEYLAIMNRMLYLDQVAGDREARLNNPVIRILRKYEKEYRMAKKVVNKMRSKTGKSS